MHDATQDLRQALTQLDASQRQVVHWEGGPLLVYAPPQSGLATTLAISIAQLLERSDDRSFHTLAITRNNLVAGRLMSQLVQLAPDAKDRVLAGTFQTLCTNVLRQHGSHVDISPDFKVYAAESDLQAVMQEAASDMDEPERMRVFSIIRQAKQRLLGPDAPPRWLTHRSRIGAVQYWRIYDTYQRILREQNALDPDSLLLYTHMLITRYPSIAKSIRSIYPHVFVTDAQAMTYSEYEILRAVAKPGEAGLVLFVSGPLKVDRNDRVLERFQDEYQPTLWAMTTFCPAVVAALANRLMAHSDGGEHTSWPPPLYAQDAARHGEYRVLDFSDDLEEARTVAYDIARRLETGSKPIGVAARSVTMLQHLKRELQTLGVKAGRYRTRAEFRTAPFAWLEAVLRLAHERRSVRHLQSVIETFHAVSGYEVDLSRVSLIADAAPAGDYLRIWLDLAESHDVDPEMHSLLQALRQDAALGSDLARFLGLAVRMFRQRAGSSFPEYAEDAQLWERVLRKGIVSPDPKVLLEVLDRELQQRSTQVAPVLLLTMGQGAGHGFEHLYIMGMADGILPAARPPWYVSQKRHLVQERQRLLAMMMRSQDTLTFSFARAYGGLRYEPSLFLREMGIGPGL